MTTFRIVSYNRGSRGAIALRDVLRSRAGHNAYTYDFDHNRVGTRRLLNDVFINWGNSRNVAIASPEGIHAGISYLNRPASVSRAVNKLQAFQTLSANVELVPYIPIFTTDITDAVEWLRNGHVAVCRTELRGHSGEGIVLANNVGQLVDAPLYTQYIKKRHEYRVHVFRNEIIDIQQKRLRNDRVTDVNLGTVGQIRNLDNGWIYAREQLSLTTEQREDVSDISKRALATLGLDFGAVDIIYNERRNAFYILEVNTAVGLEGTTAVKYADAFIAYANSRNV